MEIEPPFEVSDLDSMDDDMEIDNTNDIVDAGMHSDCGLQPPHGTVAQGHDIHASEKSSSSDEVVSVFDSSNRRSALHLSFCAKKSSDNEEDYVLSALEALPTELIHNIATLTDTDNDLTQLSLSSPILAHRLNPDNADVWRRRFMARYDHPLLAHGNFEFALAYKIRRLVLRKMDGRALSYCQRAKAEHQLLVMKDLVLETYNNSNRCSPFPPKSKNLAAISSPDLSPWIVNFMGCPLFGHQIWKYGEPHTLFDTLQVTLSHLVLSQRSPVLLKLPSSRENYDLARVYNYNKPLSIMLEKDEEPTGRDTSVKNSRFPNLETTPRKPLKASYKLNIHSVLHIRNFWQRHFTDDVQGIGENTYTSMARGLVALGKSPRKWEHPLQLHMPLETKWYGHYSCLHPWPKSRQDLEERQSCAEDWEAVDPMTLDFETRTNDIEGSFWPPLFSTIPVFEDSMPTGDRKEELNVTYIRGIAPFLELKDAKKARNGCISSAKPAAKQQKWHPFLASRIHGFVHDVPDEAVLGRKPRKERFSRPKDKATEKAIPGWRRVVMILYKPTTRQLVSALEYAAEDYGGAWGTEMNFNTAEIWNDGDEADQPAVTPANETQENAEASGDDANDDVMETNNADTATINDNDNNGPPSEVQIEAQLKKLLAKRLKTFTESYTKLLAEQAQTRPTLPPFAPLNQFHCGPKAKTDLPPLFSAKHIRHIEEEFSPARFMAWDDGTIEYAYAYEGIIIPGGKIMLGRWWRVHGIEGMGPGKEIGPDGAGVEVRPVAQPSSDEVDNEGENDGAGDSGKRRSRKRRKHHKGGDRKRQRLAKTSKSMKRKTNGVCSDEEEDEEEAMDADYEDDGYQSEPHEQHKPEKEIEYEFVTMLNGEESRAVNATKGLERGPFVFWTG